MEQVPQAEKHETFKTTILRLLKEKGKPLKREQLVKKAIKENPPRSSRPQWVYNDIIRRLKRDGHLFISEYRRMEHQVVSLEPILKEEQQKK